MKSNEVAVEISSDRIRKTPALEDRPALPAAVGIIGLISSGLATDPGERASFIRDPLAYLREKGLTLGSGELATSNFAATTEASVVAVAVPTDVDCVLDCHAVVYATVVASTRLSARKDIQVGSMQSPRI